MKPLDELMAAATQQNLGLQVAATRVLAARARLGVAVGTKYPQLQQLSAGAAYRRGHVARRGNPGSDRPAGPRSWARGSGWRNSHTRIVSHLGRALIATEGHFWPCAWIAPPLPA